MDAESIVRPIKVFVSSTHADLLEYRQSALDAILSLGETATDVIHWPAQPEEPLRACLEMLAKCDVMILIVAHNYGSLPPGQTVSFTEAEYRYAIEHSIPVLVFLVDRKTPWRVDNVDFENAGKLQLFRERLVKSHQHKTFASPDELSRLITQALIPFKGGVKSVRRFPEKVKVIPVLDSTHIANVPDVNVRIGTAPDGIPQVLAIRRSGELEILFTQLQATKPNLTTEFPHELFSKLSATASEPTRLRAVTLSDGTEEQLYVSRTPVGDFNESLLVSILRASYFRQIRIPAISAEQTKDEKQIDSLIKGRSLFPLRRHPRPEQFSGLEKVESIDGGNRFLGIHLKLGTLHLVGMSKHGWREWRPFLDEALVPFFGEGRFIIHGATPFEGALSTFNDVIREYAIEHVGFQGALAERIEFIVSRQRVGELALEICNRAIDHQAESGIHGDLKAGNVLLTKTGPVLIDSFRLAAGKTAPGFSPLWSAPEQVLGLPVSESSDVYPLGVLLSLVISTQLVGEIRRFRIPSMNRRHETSVFYNPRVFTARPQEVVDGQLRQWESLISRALRFDPLERIGLKEARDQLSDLLASRCLRGDVAFTIQTPIVAAAFSGLKHEPVRFVIDEFQARRPDTDFDVDGISDDIGSDTAINMAPGTSEA